MRICPWPLPPSELPWLSAHKAKLQSAGPQKPTMFAVSLALLLCYFLCLANLLALSPCPPLMPGHGSPSFQIQLLCSPPYSRKPPQDPRLSGLLPRVPSVPLVPSQRAHAASNTPCPRPSVCGP